MDKVIEVKVDYFLRYTAEIPADEINSHDTFNTNCICKPESTFDEENCWRTIKHKTNEQ